MNSILKLRDSDPHDDFGISPDIVPATWADKVLADIERDSKTPSADHSGSRRSDQPQLARTGAAARAAEPDFRETAAGDFKVPDIDIGNERPAGRPTAGSRMKKGITVFLFALCSALVAASWHHYGAAAQQMISAWVPPFALTSVVRPEPTGLTAQSDTADAASPAQASTQAAAADQAAPQPASAQAADAIAPAAAAPSSDAAQLQSMARDLAAMGQEVQLLKATIAELKASQQAMAARSADAKPAEVRTAVPPRPKMSAPPPRPAPVAMRRPMPAYPAYPPAQAAAPPPQQIAPPPASYQPAPPPPLAAQADDDPVVRPPMPLR